MIAHRTIAALAFLATTAPACTFGTAPPPEAPPPTTCTTAQHDWNGYHPAHDSLQPVMVNRSSYDIANAVAAWNAALEGTPVRLRTSGQGFEVAVEDGGDADSTWLGIAEGRFDSRGHMVAGRVRMNTTLLAKYDRYPSVARKVLSQEIGHVPLGLGHQQGAPDSSMDDCVQRSGSWLDCMNNPEGTTPNGHDAEQLADKFEHMAEGPSVPPCATATWVVVHSFPIEATDGEAGEQP